MGVNASSVAILEHLVRTDTASAFNISVGDVNVTGISQVCKIMFAEVFMPLPLNVMFNETPLEEKKS